MWFLQIDILIRLLVACVIFACAAGICGKTGRQALCSPFLLLFDVLLLYYVSWCLAVFYILYTIVTYAFIRFLGCLTQGRRAFFVLMCLLCTFPFFYMKLLGFFPELPALVVLTGISYNMLKAIDALYYVYYTQEPVSFLLYANYLLFFPVITAGPIFRYRDFRRIFLSPMPITGESTVRFTKRFIRGLFKKLVAAALVLLLVERLLACGAHWYVSCALATLSYLMLWLDMSGYADIAVSLGGFMGFTVPENFKHPLRAPSFTQFWRNWHVTLSDWIREHIFVVFTGRRLTRAQGALIGFVTMMFMALWHEFSLIFLIDGAICGAVLAFENLCGLTTVDRRKPKWYFALRCLLTNAVFAVTTLFFTMAPENLTAVFGGFICS